MQHTLHLVPLDFLIVIHWVIQLGLLGINKLTSLSSVMLKMKTAHSNLEFMLMLLLMKLHHLDSLKDTFIASGGA